ncbi:protein mono-ADP-ribosyltransferase PARP15-like [Myotis daubentonii]|uniref:protein mono-ADP-ribosyltransferase PARP15-like n=1 Tax=Myotis daubentonii TaxID=98922 RepID=UPI00287344F5|nr:protein mono-ADP-ribosyltransferase PARP15-like [Myotis daubentonii]
MSKYHDNLNKKVASTQTKEGLKLVLISGDVSCFQADVIVNTVPADLQLGRGSLSQSLLCTAGPMLQKELNATRQETEEEVGSIFMTSGCNLNCKAVLHVVAPDWDNGAGSSWQIMANIIKKCLMTVEQLSFSSITFPMIATGNLGFPKAVFAELILSEVSKFSSSAWLKTLQKVHFLVHLDDDESHKAFLDKFSRWSSGNPNKEKILTVGNTQGIFGTVTCSWPTVCEMKIGAVTFQVAIGDIAKESADVIVNSTTRMFNLKSDNIPEYRSDMNQQLFCMTQLQPGQSEYDTVKNKFSQTCLSYRIEKIEKIQNEFLWQSYQIKKKHMDIKNGHIDNEKILFHGTDAHSVPHVNQHGFNRSYAGKNAVAYGKGTYFAVDASYSADDKYSRPDSNGRKHIYVVRVLTGVYTLGREGIVTPPPKHPYNSIDLFDSVTDDIQHPKLFVVFFDNQAYPEYLITFRC